MDMFHKTHKCFFCRNLNDYRDVCNDNECKHIFLDIVNEKYNEELQERINTYILQLRAGL
jgi:hypothetical protein